MSTIYSHDVGSKYALPLLCSLFFSLKFFQPTPFENIFFELQFVYFLWMFIFLFVYASNLFLNKENPDVVVLYIVFLVFGVPLYSAINAGGVFDQPFFYGVASERNWFSLIFCIWIYYLISAKKISISVIERTFVFISCLSIAIFLIFIFFVDASQFSGENNIIITEESRGVRFKFQYYFIYFGLIYFFLRIIKTPSMSFYFLFLVFFIFFLVVIQGRMSLFTLLVVFSFIAMNNLSPVDFFVFLVKSMVGVLIVLVIVFILRPSYFDMMIELYHQMFNAVLSGVSDDSSSMARIEQIDIINSHWNRNPGRFLTGSGTVSQQFNDGFKSIFGYFYPTDVGLIGGVFLYGVVGVIFIYALPLLFMIYNIKKQINPDGIFLMSLKYLLLYYLLMPTQGALFFDYVQCFIPFTIMYAATKNRDA